MTIENQSKLAIIIVGWRNRRSVAVLFLHLLFKQIEQQQSSDAAFTAAAASTGSKNVRCNTDAFFAYHLQGLDNRDVVSAKSFDLFVIGSIEKFKNNTRIERGSRKIKARKRVGYSDSVNWFTCFSTGLTGKTSGVATRFGTSFFAGAAGAAFSF